MQRHTMTAATAVLAFFTLNTAFGAEYYVSIARGKGKEGSREKPAKDLGNLVSVLKDGDTVHIAEGTYVGRDESGSDQLGVALKIIGGYADDFSARDPWGAHPTIFTGVSAMKGSTQYRLIIEAKQCADLVVDGIIFDNGPRNHYATDQNLAIRRTANASQDKNATPESGGLKLEAGKGCSALVQNNIIMNTAPTGGALSVWGNQNSKLTVRNNLIINNTGEGIFLQSKWKAAKDLPEFTVERNTVLFSWKHDAIATYGGNGLKLDSELKLTASNNVFAFSDYGGIDNIKLAKQITIKDNLIAGGAMYDYREFNTSVMVSELEDEADQLTKESTGNLSKPIRVPISEAWAKVYASRKEISRASVDAKAKASNSGANALRGMLGLPLQANAVAVDAEIWLPKMEVADALKAGSSQYDGDHGCKKP